MTKPNRLRIVRDDEHVKVFGSAEFIARTRNVSLPSPTKFVRSEQVREDDVWL